MELEKRTEVGLKEPEAGYAGRKSTVIITYNDVINFPAGTYGDGDLVVYSSDRRHYENSPEALGRVLHSIHGRLNPEDIDRIYVYAGLSAMDGALNVARSLADTGKLTLVGCSCGDYKKSSFAQRHDVPLVWSECGGRSTLEHIARRTLAEKGAAK